MPSHRDIQLPKRDRRALLAPVKTDRRCGRIRPAAGAAGVAAVAASIHSSTAFPNGGQIPFNTFSHVVTTTVPITVNHQGQFPVVTLSFNLAPNVSLGDAVKAVDQVKADMRMPASIQAAYQGTAEAFQSSLANEGVLIAAALITVYLVLGVLYESYIHPL